MLGHIDLGRNGSDAPPLVPSTPLLSPATSATSLSSLSLLPSPLPALDDSSAATHLVAQVTCKQIKVYGQGLHPRIIAFDCGMKNDIVRCFVKGRSSGCRWVRARTLYTIPSRWNDRLRSR